VFGNQTAPTKRELGHNINDLEELLKAAKVISKAKFGHVLGI
jgi:hypothetical protein